MITSPPLFITNKYKKEIYDKHVASAFMKSEFRILKCGPELKSYEVGKYIKIAFQNKITYVDDRKLTKFNYKLLRTF